METKSGIALAGVALALCACAPMGSGYVASGCLGELKEGEMISIGSKGEFSLRGDDAWETYLKVDWLRYGRRDSAFVAEWGDGATVTHFIAETCTWIVRSK